jgi:hypothetical protein
MPVVSFLMIKNRCENTLFFSPSSIILEEAKKAGKTPARAVLKFKENTPQKRCFSCPCFS